MFSILLISIALVLSLFSTAQSSGSSGNKISNTDGNIKYVDPFFGTERPSSAEYGGMIPSVATPFAMTRWTPMTQENYVSTCPYLYNQTMFYGFLGTHQPAVWMGESGEVAVSVGKGSLSDNSIKVAFADRGLLFRKDQEVSKPYLYQTTLSSTEDSQMGSINVLAEITATSRASYMRYTFLPDNTTEADCVNPYIVVQATRDSINGEITVDVNRREIYGWNPERQDSVLGPTKAAGFKGYFVVRFDQDFDSFGTAIGRILNPGNKFEAGSTLSAYVTFPYKTTAVNARVGVSYISIEQARKNLDSEVPDGSTLEDVAGVVAKSWSDKLDLVNITNASEDQSKIFYTAMFHALQYPNEMMETNETGTYYYSGFDDQVHKGEYCYTGYSIWDTFRAEWAFINLFAPERVNGMVTSMLQMFEQSGRLPMWQNIVETNIMIGTHSSSLIAESLAKGFNDFDLELAWKAIWKDAMVPPKDDLTDDYHDREEGTDLEARAGLTRFFQLGYVPAVLTSEAGARTLEYAYDDYTVAVAANLTGHPEWSQFFLNRSKSYRNIWNDETQFMEAKYENGTWCDLKSTWTEATNWVYTMNVQHDFAGLRDLFKGAESMNAKLDAYYDGGLNDQTNEPSHATVFAYLYANNPAKAQSIIRSLLKDNYFNNAIGLSGNDDCGQMSAWYIFNSMGFYPVNPASAEYLIGTPLFDKMEIKFPQASTKLIINGDGAADRTYVAAVSVDGRDLTAPVLSHKDLLNAANLDFKLSSTPQDWAKNTL